jgi:hypothetical protein
MKVVTLNGGLRVKPNNDVTLTLYSSSFARILQSRDITSLDIKYEDGKFTLSPGSSRKISIERKEYNPLCVTRVARLIPQELRKELSSTGTQKKVQVVLKNLVGPKDLKSHSKFYNYPHVDDFDFNLTREDTTRVAGSINCFRHKKGLTFRFSIRHRIIGDIAKSKVKILIGRNHKGDFILRKDERGIPFCLYLSKGRSAFAYITISPDLIKKFESDLFFQGRRSIPTKVYFSRNEFGIDISKYFIVKEEQELASGLLQLGFNIRIPQMGKREADIVLRRSKVQIEITRIKTRRNPRSSTNSPHTDGIFINARICEGFLKVSKKIVPLYIVVFREEWLDFKWVRDLIATTSPEVFCLTTNFNKGWEEQIAREIKVVMEQRGLPL